MTTSLGQALPGLVSTRAPSKPAASSGKNEEIGFGDMMRGAEKPSVPDNQRATGPHDPRWAKRTSVSPGKSEPTHSEPGKIASLKLPAGKPAKADPDSDPRMASADTEQTGQGTSTAPLQDQLPLLMALNHMRHFSTSAKADGDNAAPDEQLQDTALDSQSRSLAPAPLSSKKHRSASGVDTGALGAMSRSERGSIAEGLSGPNPRQRPVQIEPGSDEPLPQDDMAFRLPGDRAATDISALEAKRSAPVTKGPEAAQSAAPSERAKQVSSAARIDIVAEQSFPAPAQNPMSQTASAVIDAIASDGLRQALSTPSTASQMASSVVVPTHILKIELHPAELGMVTASLRLAGEQLSIELKPETNEAYRRLVSDSETIVKSLRGLGFDVGNVTVLQPSVAIRADASGSLPMSPGRDQPSFQPGDSSGNSAGSGGQQPGRNHDNDAQKLGRSALPARDRTGDDMFI
jgi:chemotaxis protein MotD